MATAKKRKTGAKKIGGTHECALKLQAINQVQAVIEFNMDGTVITANENFLKTLGYTLDEVKGRHHRMFCDAAYVDSPEYQAFWAKLNRGESESGLYQWIGKGGGGSMGTSFLRAHARRRRTTGEDHGIRNRRHRATAGSG